MINCGAGGRPKKALKVCGKQLPARQRWPKEGRWINRTYNEADLFVAELSSHRTKTLIQQTQAAHHFGAAKTKAADSFQTLSRGSAGIKRREGI